MRFGFCSAFLLQIFSGTCSGYTDIIEIVMTFLGATGIYRPNEGRKELGFMSLSTA